MRNSMKKTEISEDKLNTLFKSIKDVKPPKGLAEEAIAMAKMRMAADKRKAALRRVWVKRSVGIAAALVITVGAVVALPHLTGKGGAADKNAEIKSEDYGYSAGADANGFNVGATSPTDELNAKDDTDVVFGLTKDEAVQDIEITFADEQFAEIKEAFAALPGVIIDDENGLIVHLPDITAALPVIEQYVGICETDLSTLSGAGTIICKFN